MQWIIWVFLFLVILLYILAYLFQIKKEQLIILEKPYILLPWLSVIAFAVSPLIFKINIIYKESKQAYGQSIKYTDIANNVYHVNLSKFETDSNSTSETWQRGLNIYSSKKGTEDHLARFRKAGFQGMGHIPDE